MEYAPDGLVPPEKQREVVAKLRCGFFALNRDLFNLIVSSPAYALDEPQARFIFKQVAVGLNYLHKQHFVHRDIKPEVQLRRMSIVSVNRAKSHCLSQNILLSNGRAIIADFGYAAPYGDTPLFASLGSLHYASPEIIVRGRSYVGPEVDVWSLGISLHLQMLIVGPQRFDWF